MNKFYILLFFLAFAKLSNAQELFVKSFIIVESDLTAQTQPRKDLNDKNCALIKVQFVGDILDVEGNVVYHLQKRNNETWVYMPQGSRQIKVLPKNYLPIMITFANYGVEKLESNRTYVLILAKPISISTQQKQTLVLQYSPSSATVLIDNKIVKGSNSIIKATLPIGQHSYVVACDGYESEEGVVKLKPSIPTNLHVQLAREVSCSEEDRISVESSTSLDLVSLREQIESVSPPNISNNDIVIKLPDGSSFEMVKVEKGTFFMDADVGQEAVFDSEKPKHQVTLTRDYYIGKFEVTQGLWTVVMGKNPSKNKNAIYPVDNVSWNDCQKFLKNLNAWTGRHFRLPTEAEWEFAARGGNKSKNYEFSGSNAISDVAWNIHNSGLRAHKIATKQANELGIYDMSGNVFEWCQDWKRDYSNSPETDPIGSEKGTLKVTRGGSWGVDGFSCRPSCRYFNNSSVHSVDLGFRLALSE